MPKKEPVFKVHCGDAHLYFGYGRLYRQSYLEQIFEKRIAPVRAELFPGLVVADSHGNLWMPELRVELVPVEQKPCT